MRKYTTILLLTLLPADLFAQIKVSFNAKDKLVVTADYYPSGNAQNRYILLFHQSGSSRGEYRKIAPKLKNLEYNCLSVDLRSGEQINFIKNETAERAKNLQKITSPIEAKKDIEAAIEYAYNKTNKRVILMGSSYSASLCLLEAKTNPKVKGVLAFSPGEFFRPFLLMKNEIKGFNKPVFVCGSKLEYDYAKKILENVPENKKQLFTPGKCAHGAKALWDESENSNEIWLAMLMFFQELKKDPFD